jgi:hypothetical protein
MGLRTENHSQGELQWSRVGTAGLLPAAVGLGVAAVSGAGLELREVGMIVVIAVVCSLVDVTIQTGPIGIRRHPQLFRLAVLVVLLFGLVAATAPGPT